MLTLAILLAASFVLSWLGAVCVMRQAARWRLVQIPNARSSHTRPTPGGGGLGIVLATLIAAAWLSRETSSSGLLAVVACGLPLAIVGMLDDVRHQPTGVRLAVQTFAVAGLLVLSGFVTSTIQATPLDLLLVGSVLLSGLWWINLFNFMDGIDGLAGVQAIFMLLVAAGLAAWAYPASIESAYWPFALCIAAAVLGFLVLNWPPARIFMGDVGSTWLAFMIFAIALHSVREGWLSYAVWLVLGATFIADASMTLVVRVLRGERWHEAHRSHAYQRLSRKWEGTHKRGHLMVASLTTALNLLWLLPLAIACIRLPQWEALWLGLAYIPLLAGTYLLGAGRPDRSVVT